MSHLLQNVVCMVGCGLVGMFAYVIVDEPWASHFAAGSGAYIFLVCVWTVIAMTKQDEWFDE